MEFAPFDHAPTPCPPVPDTDGIHRVRLRGGGQAWLKRRRDRPAGFLAAEAHGLHALREAGGLRVPRVLGLGAHELMLEDLGRGTAVPDFAARAGRGLAAQHRHTAPTHGFDVEGWCGESVQDNTRDADGHRFFAERRLRPQALRAHRAGRIADAGLAAVERICGRLAQWIPPQPPSLLHGDLWIGNLHCCADGMPALIDAGAVHYGFAEADLAMLVLFGQPDPRLFDAYAEQADLAPGWRERAPLYNLYHLLNHLNLFGAGYAAAVATVLRRFA